MYFVHSYYVRPVNPELILSTTPFGSKEFPSALGKGQIFATQFHPERSGPEGLKIYEKLASAVPVASVGEIT
jgi:imidazoleglycerol phosphate synthase glutamine amidotransferase subunit HisH